MSYDFIQVETKDHVTTFLLNRPEVLNSINPQMHEELQHAFDAFAADDAQWIGVVRGVGERAFCAGSDLKAAAATGVGRSKYPKNGYAGLIERFDLEKPLIAAVNGLAFGGGFEVALACDILIAAPHAQFGLPEPLVGAVALGGGLHRLARQIGLKQAMGMVLSAAPVNAQRGYELGFVTEVADDLDEAVARWCALILRGAPLAIRASKATIMQGLDEPSLADAIRNQKTYPAFAAWNASEDAREGPLAFAEKRKPNWKGR
ncbi:MAG: enoyl-CoA hydratase-related protein [Hyphomonadaceae bacterium]